VVVVEVIMIEIAAVVMRNQTEGNVGSPRPAEK